MCIYRVSTLLCAILSISVVPVLSANAEPLETAPAISNVSQNQITSTEEAKLASQANAKQNLLSGASTLIKAGKSTEAYELLIPYQSELAGDESYDYLLGLAALDSGKPNIAIFALERVLAVNPGHLQARAEIARAYLVAGEMDASEQEFKTVQQQNPPKEVSASIQKYLDVIETYRSGQTTTFHSYVEASVGEDSNANTGTSNQQVSFVFLPGGTPFTTTLQSGKKTRDTFAGLATGFSVRHLLTKDLSILGGINLNTRNNGSLSTLDTASIDGNLGLSQTKGNNTYSAILQAQTFSLNIKNYRDSVGMIGQWQRDMGNGSQTSLYLQYTNLSYYDFSQRFRNAHRYMLGGAYATQLSGDSAPVIYAGGYGGMETPQRDKFTSNSACSTDSLTCLENTFVGIRDGGELKLAQQFTMLASASMEGRIYTGKEKLFQNTLRSDTQTDLRLAVNYAPDKKWIITPSISYTDNDSNLGIYKYQRSLFSISARHNFN